MLQGTPQDQIPPSPEHSAGTTAIPVPAVDADQLPREKGFTYEEMTSIIGALYLDSAHRAKVQDEQFNAVMEEYEKSTMQIKAEVQVRYEEVESLRKQIATLTRELEARHDTENRTRSHPSSGSDRDNSMPDNR